MIGDRGEWLRMSGFLLEKSWQGTSEQGQFLEDF